MKLIAAQVTKYRSIDDSTKVELEPDVTALVGKNESGKTSFLRALHGLKPVDGATFDFDIEFPRKDWADYKDTAVKEPVVVVRADFELQDPDVGAFKEEFGSDTLVSSKFTVKKDYANKVTVDVSMNEKAAIRHFLTTLKVDSEAARAEALKCVGTLAETTTALTAHADPAVKALAPPLAKRFPKSVNQTTMDWIWKRLPTFVYFSDYEFMPGTASIPYLIDRKNNKNLTIGETTLLRLISRAGLTLDELKDERKFERHVASLEAAAISITKEVFKFWTQNKNLKVKFLTSGPEAGDARLQNGPLVRVRIENTKHDVTVPFDERSRGFVWFFSFLAYFNELERTADTGLILLLDEPGQSLHATAQADLLRFIDDRLSVKCQVVYTTHSPFMVDARRLTRVRTVQDMDDGGTVVSRDVFRNDAATIFPLQAALGLEITQSLFVGPNNLLVEGKSEVLYLPIMGARLATAKRTNLNPRWTVVPIGGIDKAPSFVSLFGGQKLHLALLMDYANHQRKLVDELRKKLGSSNVLSLNMFRDGKESDIEDMFEVSEYLAIVNEVYRQQLRKPIVADDLTLEGDRIVPRIEHYFAAHHINGGTFQHGHVAEQYARGLKDGPALSEATLARFEAIFAAANNLLPDVGGKTVLASVPAKAPGGKSPATIAN